MATKMYLVAYNLASCAGWAYVWTQTVKTLLNGGKAGMLWNEASDVLAVVQSLAALEIVHSLLRLVKSPVFTVFMQVNSRLIVLWLYTWQAAACHSHWSLLLMVGSWATVEVPRYLFYALNLLPSFQGSKMPYPLFWLRYSLFMVLYPTGITGELVQMYVALSTHYTFNTAWERFLFVFPLIAYPPASPFMVLNMWKNRKSQFRKRAQELAAAKEEGGASAKKAVSGLVWPVTNDATGERSTSVTNQSIWEYAVSGADADAAAAVRKTRKWRFGYLRHIESQVRISLRSKETALQIARDGLARAHEAFEFVRDGKATSLAEAMDKYKGSYETGFIKGEGKREVKEARVLYKGQTLVGDALVAQLEKWVSEGVIEPSAGDAVKQCIAHPEWYDLSDRYFVLLGATSAMGPLDLLLQCGANVIGIDLDRAPIWEKLINKVRASPGTLTFPLSKPQASLKTDADLFAHAGANLLGATPEIANWLVGVCPGQDLTIGNYTYLDGALHVQLSIACDAIMQKVLAKRSSSTSLAFLLTPTDVYMINEDAFEVAKANYKAAPAWQKALEKVMGKNDMVCNVLKPADGSGLKLSNAVVSAQGPNYSLAKRIQQWRCIIAHSEGHTVSSNVAPSTSTASVTSNPLFAAAYAGFKLFKALEVFRPETSSSLMLALLINDIRNPESISNPKSAVAAKMANPLELFAHNAAHGGSFRCPYSVGTIGTVSVLYYFIGNYWFAALPVVGLTAYTVSFVATGARPGLAAKQ
ncbi:Very-long-chain 3R-3-hydroxyacyl-CoA dehydratase [Hondaea fermentalgiana]|uniref:very-long-chain (3R)-3-hydroxyacyl-CoA dehydratase n=1 Tax=Hondaea fermentalgiana TaxID=2315210 RepID=A0A2R5GN07_9STRA|nr:Very-long-chain 3R-3-hydroxyacyl-CoA dehydratase [Hondaea fermentalgiana]|eukprot:GBG31679.1 Very-long-chain 3R-3-hydroxyacyl-CoA dehydratase [Hondaea fermentalgiana]